MRQRSIQALREEHADTQKRLSDLVDGTPPGSWSAKQQREYDQGMKELDGIRSEINQIEDVHQRIAAEVMGHAPSGSPFAVKVNGRMVPVISSRAKLADHFSPADDESDFSLAGYVRNAMGIETPRNAVTSGPALVPDFIGAEIIDSVRAASAISESGASTIVIDGPTNLAKITGDPTVYQHDEGVEDIMESSPTFAPVTLNPKSLVAAIPLTAEVVADSPNLDSALQVSIAAAFAKKLDVLSLATILADATIPTSAAGQDPATWAGVMAAVGAALAVDQRLPVSYIGSEADFIARAGQTTTDGAWLGRPPVLADMLELPTTGIAAGTGVFGDFARAFAIAVRQNLRLEVIRLAKYKSYSHVLVCHARMDGVILQPGHLFIQKAIV